MDTIIPLLVTVTVYYSYNYSGAVYFTIANIDPAQRSKLDAVHLVALIECDLFSQYTIDDILLPFFDDLKMLSQV
jgi:hypothetical protein